MCPNPWIGGQYGSSNDLDLPPRLLILGESHHGDGGVPLADLTNTVIDEHIADGHGMFFNNVRRAILCELQAVANNSRQRFWNAVAFYNFVPTPVAAANIPPEPDQLAAGQLLFPQRLVELHPTHVVACGFRLWNHLPNDGFVNLENVNAELAQELWNRFPEQHPHHGDENAGWAGRYGYDGGACSIVKIRHPSFHHGPHFNPEDWRLFLQYFLAHA